MLLIPCAKLDDQLRTNTPVAFKPGVGQPEPHLDAEVLLGFQACLSAWLVPAISGAHTARMPAPSAHLRLACSLGLWSSVAPMLKTLLRSLVTIGKTPAAPPPPDRAALDEKYWEAIRRVGSLPNDTWRSQMDCRLHDLEQGLRGASPPSAQQARSTLAQVGQYLDGVLTRSEQSLRREIAGTADNPELARMLERELDRVLNEKAVTQPWFNDYRTRIEALLRDTSGFER
jgi:hypothetical protein